MDDADRYQLLHGPYTPLPLRRGDRAACLVRGAEVVVIGWSEAPIPWPRCRAVGRLGACGLLVDGELARAVRSESSLAIQHWWGVKPTTVSKWRKALGMSNWGTDGSRRLLDATIVAAAERR